MSNVQTEKTYEKVVPEIQMWALEYQGPGKKDYVKKKKPIILAQTDAVVKMVKTTICGTDLHILKGDVPTVTPGRILGHEGIGIIESIGESVNKFKVGDRVLISCITSDGICDYCKRGMFSHCENGGWVLGNKIDGTQAEFVRIPYADTSLYSIPEGANEDAMVMLSDILPTGFECGVLNGKISPGDVVAIVGAGPIGLAALLTAQFFAPSEVIMIDVDDERLKRSKEFGATLTINSKNSSIKDIIMKITDSRGVDVAIEAVGIPQTFEVCQDIISPGGRIANIGVHGKSVELHLEKLWDKNITITTRLVDTTTTSMLLKTVKSGKLKPEKLITHHFQLSDVIKAYDTFGNAQKEKALKVIISNEVLS
ncbi:MAG: zinc-dependent alcohol dehydrogenase family protein [Bacteriovorax sp.]|nr:zinc-dependent alcohol dehydrogenase family protein [Bacteriovorax sp.]